MYPATLSHDSVNCAANLFLPVLKVYFPILVMGDSYAFAVAVKFPPPFRGKYLVFLPLPRPAPRPATACWLISLLSWAPVTPWLILDYVEKTSILTLNA
jgi:hypothetical protein